MAEAKKKLIIVCDDKNKKYGEFLSQLISSDGIIAGREIGPKAGEVQSVVWTEKDYQGNAVKVSSDQYVVFIGNGKVAKEQRIHMISQFSYYGMNYGWLGKKATISVEETMSKVSEYREFYNFILDYKPEVVSLIEDKKSNEKPEALIEEKMADVVIEVNAEVSAENTVENGGSDHAAVSAVENVQIEEKKTPNKLLMRIGIAVDKVKEIQKNTQENFDDTIGGGNPVKQGVIKGKICEQQYDCLILAFYQKGLKEFLGL